MTNTTYPTLLNTRARIFASLNRIDLIVLGITYLVFSKLDYSGIEILLISLVFLLINKFLMSRLERSFLKGLSRTNVIDWSGAIGRLK